MTKTLLPLVFLLALPVFGDCWDDYQARVLSNTSTLHV